MLKRVLLILLSVILALLITLTTLYIVDIAHKRSLGRKGDAYFAVSLCYTEAISSKRIISEDCKAILDEFGITSVISADDVLTAELTASNQGQSVLMVTTSVDITNKAQNFAHSLSGKSSELKHIEFSGIITDSTSRKMRQLWRLENDTERVTAYRRCNSELYVLSIKLSIDKFEFAKQNGTETTGFIKGRIKLAE